MQHVRVPVADFNPILGFYPNVERLVRAVLILNHANLSDEVLSGCTLDDNVSEDCLLLALHGPGKVMKAPNLDIID